MDPIRDALAMLGGAAMLGDASVRSYLDFDRIAHAGVPFGAFSRLVAEIDRPEKSVAESIGIARTTFLRRRDEGRFALEESQRVLRLGLIIALGKRALGSASAAGRWLSKPNEALGGRIPLELLQTDFGSRQVEAVLGRALLGGYS